MIKLLVSRLRTLFSRRVSRRRISTEWELVPYDWCKIDWVASDVVAPSRVNTRKGESLFSLSKRYRR